MESTRKVTIVGQGYVGLPLAQEAVRNGWKVFGLDKAETIIRRLAEASSHVDDLTDADIAEMLRLGYEPTTDPACIAESSVVIVCVPTPLGEAGSPDLGAVEAATRSAAIHLKKGTTYILESTTYPGTTTNICVPLLEEGSGLKAGRDFGVAYSPERVDPGSTKFGIKNTPKLVGGIDKKSTEAATQFYSDFVDTVVPLKGTKEAETAKLLENTFRHVNIALVNEMAKFCHELNIDIWEVIHGAATKPFGFMKFTPGPGVGGHCIPIDPNYLSYEVRKQLGYPFRFVELAQEINNSMPRYVVDRISEILNDVEMPMKNANVLLLGATYKANIADERQSPSVPVAEELLRRGANVHFHDPFVQVWNLPGGIELQRVPVLDDAIDKADVVVLLQPHREYDLSMLELGTSLFFDATGKASSTYRFKL